MSKADGPITARSPTLIVPPDLYELHGRIKALKLDPGKGFAPQLVERADGAGGVAATKWPADVSLFVNDDGDGTQIDVWHDGVCGGPMLTATSAESARAIIGAIDELHGLRERLADFQADYRKVMSDQCAPDEHHCSCVPHLRARIAELERERVNLKRDLSNTEHAAEVWKSAEHSASSTARTFSTSAEKKQREIETLTAQLDAARVEIGHLQDMLIRLREGAPTPPATPTIPTARARVLTDVHDERERQDAKFGRDRNHPLAYSGFRGRPRDLCAAYGLPSAQDAQARCDAAMKAGRVTYGHILVEEVCEFFEAAAGRNVAEMRKELVQVVAVGVAMVEALDRAVRRLAQADAREVER